MSSYFFFFRGDHKRENSICIIKIFWYNNSEWFYNWIDLSLRSITFALSSSEIDTSGWADKARCEPARWNGFSKPSASTIWEETDLFAIIEKQ